MEKRVYYHGGHEARKRMRGWFLLYVLLIFGNRMTQQESGIDLEHAVRHRYTAAAAEREQALCCPVEYEGKYLEVLPQDLVDRDYGCGNPAEYVTSGETVLDLGSGGGKICYILSQVVGPEGQVLGVDQNDDMLALARCHRSQISEAIGWENTEFYKGNIQDLGLDLEVFDEYLAANPVQSYADWQRVDRWIEERRQVSPMVASQTIDVVVSNCVLNLVNPKHRDQLFAEIFRVLRPGGRAIISDIVSDQTVPIHLQNNPNLWSGCISGAFTEDNFIAAFRQAGFHGVETLKRQTDPWAVVEGIEFRSVTVRANKEGTSLSGNLQINRDEAKTESRDAELTILPKGNCCGPSDDGCC